MKFSLHFFLVLLLCSNMVLGQKYKPGQIVNKNGTKISGTIKFNRAGFSVFGSKPSSIKFKQNSKPIKYTANDLIGFSIGSDSYKIVNNIKINSIQGFYEKDFAKVLIEGKLNLFEHYSSSSDGQYNYEYDRLVICNENNSKCLGIFNLKNQKDELLKFFEIDKEIHNRIKASKWKDINIVQLVAKFNAENR